MLERLIDTAPIKEEKFEDCHNNGSTGGSTSPSSPKGDKEFKEESRDFFIVKRYLEKISDNQTCGREQDINIKEEDIKIEKEVNIFENSKIEHEGAYDYYEYSKVNIECLEKITDGQICGLEKDQEENIKVRDEDTEIKEERIIKEEGDILEEKFDITESKIEEVYDDCEDSKVNMDTLNEVLSKSITESKKYKRKKEGIYNYNCYHCPFKTQKRFSMLTHVKIHRDGKPHQCPHCDYKGRNKKLLNSHLLRHLKPEEKNWLRCPHCTFKTCNKKKLQNHRISFHEDNENYFYCSQCDYKSKAKYNLLRHMRLHQGIDKWFLCSECPYKAPYKQDILSHSIYKHTNDHKLKELLLVYKCDVCIFRAKSKNVLSRHKISVHGIRVDGWYVCKSCKYKTTSKSCFDNHVEKHKGNALHKCTECKYTTCYKGNLSVHMVTHMSDNKIQWFTCTECPYRSKWKYYLVKHQKRRHQWFYCFNCTFKTQEKKFLIRHIQMMHSTTNDA